jgi:hypothetical protein
MKRAILILFGLCFTLMLQAQNHQSVDINAGELSFLFSTEQLKLITQLEISGSIDARDFKTIRDFMPMLEVLDLSQVKVLEFNLKNFKTYEANAIPDYAFYDEDWPSEKRSNLTYIKLPASIHTIGRYAFCLCDKLKSISLPSSLTTIKFSAFWGCRNLDSITIPSSVLNIEQGSLNNSSHSFEVAVDNPIYSSIDGVLFNKEKTELVQFPIQKFGNYTIPSTVTSIGYVAFRYTDLTSIIIPSTVTSIGNSAFRGCKDLKSITIQSNSIANFYINAFYDDSSINSIYIYSKNLSDSDKKSLSELFYDIDKPKCNLYVPMGTKSLYQNIENFKDFKNIIEDQLPFLKEN